MLFGFKSSRKEFKSLLTWYKSINVGHCVSSVVCLMYSIVKPYLPSSLGKVTQPSLVSSLKTWSPGNTCYDGLSMKKNGVLFCFQLDQPAASCQPKNLFHYTSSSSCFFEMKVLVPKIPVIFEMNSSPECFYPQAIEYPNIVHQDE